MEATKVLELTGLYENIEARYVTPLIDTVRDGVIKPLLGKQLFEYINTLPEDNSVRLLMERIWSYRVVAQLYQTQFLRLTNRGVEKKVATDFSQSPTQEELAVTVNYFISTANGLAQTLLSEVEADPTLSAYYKVENGVKGLKPTSIFFPPTKKYLD